MPKWLTRTLLILLGLAVLSGALFGAFYLGRQAGTSSTPSLGAGEADPRLDRDRIKPSLRDDGTFLMPGMPMDGRFFSYPRFSLLGMLIGIFWLAVRLGLLVLLIWLVVRWVLNRQKPAAAPPPPPSEPPAV
ncbi:MAG: hypothetical protein MUC85_04490 [Anaerolineales bacterium]|jgi:hypothetical protein|nr:hypothetical protein [Anaerolineales bacterium]